MSTESVNSTQAEEQVRDGGAHTPEQIAAWRKYERVRQGGRFNMFDPRARKASRLSEGSYRYCMSNYSTLREAAQRSKS